MEKVTQEEQTFDHIKKLFKTGRYDIYDVVRAGFFENHCEYPKRDIYSVCEHCGSKYKDEKKEIERREKINAFHTEESRLYTMFKDALFLYHDLDGSQERVQKAFALAWDRGHPSGYHEVANVFEDLVDLIR